MSEIGLKRLNVWVQAKDLAVYVYERIVPCLPIEEKWGLSVQLKRSASSIPANIAEGYGRFYYQSNIQFCYNARGSLEETISHVLLANELGYLPPEVYAAFIDIAEALTVLLNGYIAYLKKSKIGFSESNHQVREIFADYEIPDPFMGGDDQ